MEQLKSDITFKELHNLLSEKILHHLNGLDNNNKGDKQKILELCQVGKLIATYFNDFQIVELREKPDFIITNGEVRVALEHELIINYQEKAREGYYENICEKIEIALNDDLSLPDFLINLYFKDNLDYKNRDKNELISQLTVLVKQFIETGILIENDIVIRAVKMKHSKKCVCANFGACSQKSISKELVIEHIKKKENRINTYIQNTALPQWLVMVIGGLGKSSYEVNQTFKVDIDSKFEKIFLYEDFANNLYRIK
jgi:hypothetical protein